MALLETEIDMSNIDPSKPREVLPPGWYKVIIEESEVKPTKKAASAIEYNETSNPAFNDKILVIPFKVIEGEHTARIVFNNYNYVNSNQTAQEIARKDVAALRTAIGIPKEKPFRDSDELHHKPLQVLLEVEKKEGQTPRNVVKGYRPIGEAIAASPGMSSGVAKTTPAQPAWNRK